MKRLENFGFIAFYCIWCVIAEGAVAKGKNLYISRVLGKDSWPCSRWKPCKNIWRAITLASDGDHIHLDGTNTDKDPYTCQSGTSQHQGIYINKSMSLAGSASPTPQIRCSEGTGLTFDGSYNVEQMNVTLSGLLLNESFVIVQDSSVNINGCKFEDNKRGVQIVIRTSMIFSIQITNSTFSRNGDCISVFINGSQNQSHFTKVMFKLMNSAFDGNFLSDEGGCISFSQSPYNKQSVSSNIALENVRFSRNMFSSKGLVFLEMDHNSNQHVNLQNVTFNDNRASPDRDVSPVYGDSEFIISSTDVDIIINSSNFAGQNARSFNICGSNVSLQIYNTIFFGHRVEGNGGVISVRGRDLCKLNLSNSSFVKTTAAQGGAIFIECGNANKIIFEDVIFTDSRAKYGSGGALYIDVLGSVLDDAKNSTNTDKAQLHHSSERTEQLCQIYIDRCAFTKSHSSTWGGAVYIKIRRASIRLLHSAFIKCTTLTVGIRQEGGGGGVFISSGSKSTDEMSRNGLFLTVEGSRFIRCGSFGYSALSISGTLSVVSTNQMEIRIKNSHFISNHAGYIIDEVAYGGAIYIFSSKVNHITIEHSIFSNNGIVGDGDGGAIYVSVSYKSVVIFQKVIVESNSVKGAAITTNSISTLKIYQSRFLKNTGASIKINDVTTVDVQDSLFDGGGGALFINDFVKFTSIVIFNTTFKNCSIAPDGHAMYLSHKGNVRLEVKRSRFLDNVGLRQYRELVYSGTIFLSLAPDTETNPGCIKLNKDLPTAIQIDDAKEFPSWMYKSHVVFEDTMFENNAVYAGGVIYITNGKTKFQNCSFTDNFVATLGGNIYTVAGSASVIIEGSVFRQTKNELKLLKASFIHAESSGALKLHNTTMETTAYGSTGPLIQVSNGRLIDFGHGNNLATFNCPVGSQMEILSFTNQFTTHVNNTPCKIKVSTLEFSCSACPGNSYSLQHGRALGSQIVPGFQCLPCPFGANCSQNILAKPNFWGFKEHRNPPTLTFIMCPLGYCSPPNETNFPEYNGCQGNRTGELCGHCNETYTETLYSSKCRPSYECKDYWFWPVTLLYVSLMALYFTFRPPIVPWIKHQILWFKKQETTNEEDDFDRGYLKIIFYFYQAANLLLISNSSQHIFETEFIEPFVGLFSFQQRFSQSGLICPFPGLTVITKQLFSASHVFGTCLMIGVFYCLHWGVKKCRGKEAPHVGPYTGGILQTMLLGYTTLSSVSFKLLRCVPIGTGKRLFYDGNVVCFQWWQYILIGFVCAFFVPFVLVLLWGPVKVYSRSISAGEFFLACCFPLPCLLYWALVSLFCTARNAENIDPSSSQMSNNSVERVLYESFKKPEDCRKLSLSWESVMIGRRLILIVLRASVSDPMLRLLIMSIFCVLFLLHHALTQPFRDCKANILETISLLSVLVLAIVNVFFASFLSLAVPLNSNFSSWRDVFRGVEILILCALPFFFGLILVAAVLSQVCRLIAVVCLSLRKMFWVCFSWSCRQQNDEMRPLLT